MKGRGYELVSTDGEDSGWAVNGSKLVLSFDELVVQLRFRVQ